jgi:hypothetical protein
MNQEPPSELAVVRELNQKVSLVERVNAGAEFIVEPEVLTNYRIIQSNAEREASDAGSASQERILNHLSGQEPDVFKLQEKAAPMVDILLEGTTPEKLDAADFFAAARGFLQVINMTRPRVPARLQAKVGKRHGDLAAAFSIELAGRIPTLNMLDEDDVDPAAIYDRLFGATAPDDSEEVELRGDAVSQFWFLADTHRQLRFSYHPVFRAFQDERPIPPEQRSGYSSVLSDKDRTEINEAAAENIERLHLLGAYGIAPLAVQGHQLELPFDIAIMPPANSDPDLGEVPVYEEGAVADFTFWQAREDRREVLAKFHYPENEDEPIIMEVGGEPIAARLRLHHNGQISYGHWHHNIPNDNAEKLFGQLGQEDSFVRLRALLIAMAFDAVAPTEVVEGEVGGSIATEYAKQRELHPTGEPLIELLLGRRRALRKADVSPKNRQPRGWELPIRFVGGYTKKLPAGYKRRPTAEQEAREYFTSIGLAFEGLPEGKNFVGEYKRGTLPADTPFRLARFHSTSVTKTYLGNLGVAGRRPPKRPDKKKSKKNKRK